ncbi:MAG: hypothetical protein KUG78_13695 [Kangiellaceae bacterium]|nr:hypothetical protein [Kangiellaceae bacterium]
MQENKNSTDTPVQSTATLVKASIAAIVISALVYFMLILPAEYNQDPTGVGKLLGLTVLSQAAEEVVDASSVNTDTTNPNAGTSNETDAREQSNQVQVLVPARRGVEYKFKMKQYAKLTYDWKSDGTPLYFDFHGEPEGDTTGYFESYAIATADNSQGKTMVPFNGVHGWYWKNTTDKDVVVTLKTSGVYEVIGKPH